jgi:DNA-binding response OmpR family regulator
MMPEQDGPSVGSIAPFGELRFLIVDDNPDSRFLISKTLLRKYPAAVIVECASAEPAFRVLERERISAIVCHRTFEFNALALVVELRKRNQTVPILAVSGIDRSGDAITAGATAFLTADEWLMVGHHVEALLTTSRPLRFGALNG